MAGRKVFSAGEVLQAADVNDFLMDQSVMVFAGTAARGSAIPSPTEGMVTYLEDADEVQVYTTDWTAVSQPGVLQVVSTTKTDTFTTTSASYTDVTGLSVSITPASSSNKVWVTGHIAINTPLAGGLAFFQIVRDSTPIAVGDAAGTRAQATGFRVGSSSGSFDNGTGMWSFNFLDSPSTTSSTTYKIQMTAGGSATIAVNRSLNDADSFNRARTTSTITAVEVAG